MSEKKGINLVVYPREYVLDGNDSDHFVKGVDAEGNDVIVQLEFNKAYLDSVEGDGEKTIPSLSNMAKTGRKARNPAYADAENGPGSKSREGVILFSKVIEVEPGKYKAGWAVVLAEASDTPEPLVGVGRVDMSYFNSDEMRRMEAELKALKQKRLSADSVDRVALDDELKQLQVDFDSKANYYFKVVVPKADDAVQISSGSKGEVSQNIKLAVEGNTEKGMYGGALIRVVEADGTVNNDFNAEITSYFTRGSVVATSKLFDDWQKWQHGTQAMAHVERNEGAYLEIIPTQNINAAPASRKTYQKPGALSKVRNTYFDPDDESVKVMRPVAVRFFESVDGQKSLMMSTVHATGESLGDQYLMPTNDGEVLRYSGQAPAEVEQTQSRDNIRDNGVGEMTA